MESIDHVLVVLVVDHEVLVFRGRLRRRHIVVVAVRLLLGDVRIGDLLICAKAAAALPLD